MAPTLSHMHTGVAMTTAGSKHVTPQHRHTVSITHTKGLLNAPGQNNCFLNSAVQVLWHLDIFRRSFRDLSGHACMADSCIFCALKELFAQFQYSHESALPPDALRRALAETFFNQQRFQLGFMDDAAECFENILLRIHFHIANNESEDMCNATHCIPHQKFAMTLVEQGVCHACGATSEPLPFTQMVHYVTSSTLCAQAKLSRENGDHGFLQDFGKLLRKAGGMGEMRDCPSACGAKIQIQRTLMNHPEIMSIGIVWDSERPTLDHIMDVFQAIGSIIHLRDVFHTVMDDRWAASAEHQLVGIVTYYGKHYSTFFFHTKLRVWIYFDDATVREIGPRWEQVVEKCRRGHFQPLLLLYANPHGSPVTTESAPKTVVYSRVSHLGKDYPGYRSLERVPTNKSSFVTPRRRAMTPNPEKQDDAYTNVIPRRAITPNPEVHYRHELQANPMYQHDMVHSRNNGHGSLPISENGIPKIVPGSKSVYGPGPMYNGHGAKGLANDKGPNPDAVNSIYNMEMLQSLLQNKCCNTGPVYNGRGGPCLEGTGPLRATGYFNNCDVIDGNVAMCVPPTGQNGDVAGTIPPKDAFNESVYISRKAVENVLNYQKLQRHRSNSENDSAAGSRNSNSSLDSFENAFRMRNHHNVKNVLETQRPEATADVGVMVAANMKNVPRCRDSGNWSGDRNSASSTSSTSVENPYFIMGGNRRVSNGFRGSPVKGPMDNGGHRVMGAYDAGYDSFSLSSNDSFPMSHIKHHNQHLAQILENPSKPVGINAMSIKNPSESVDECHALCLEADKFLEKSLENEKVGDLDGAISLCNSAAAKARAAMDAPYSNPQIQVFARMKHNTCIMRARTLHRRLLVRKDSISSQSSSTGTDLDSPQKVDGPTATSIVGHHSRQSSRDSIRSRGSINHSRQSSRDGNHSRQSSKDSTLKDATSDKKRIELYGTLPKRNGAKKTSKAAETSLGVSADVRPAKPKAIPIPIVHDTRIPRRISFRSSDGGASKQQQQHHEEQYLKTMKNKLATANFNQLDPPNNVALYSDRDVKHKPTLHRTNSIPANFISKIENTANRTLPDAISPATAKQAESFGSNAKVGKKQHKIRRKLLMGGLIRRKNRSMPDLREGQNTSPGPEVILRCYDDSGLQRTVDGLENRLNHHPHHHSSHGKIPPPPPVRTTSQLTSRSQSHGNLFNTPQPPPPKDGRKMAFDFPCPVVPNSDGAHREITIQADIHHERTPSDNIRPVSLARTLSMRGLPSSSSRILQRFSSNFSDVPSSQQQHPSSQNTSTLPSNQLSSKHPSSHHTSVSHPPAQHHPSHQDSVMTVSANKSKQPDVTDRRDDTKSSNTDSGSGLLEQLLCKRQQMLDNPSKMIPEKQPDVNVPLSGGDGWLRELQAKQQMMLSKKPAGSTSRSPPVNHAQENGLPTGLQWAYGMQNLDHSSKITNQGIPKPIVHESRVNGHALTPPTSIPAVDELRAEANYTPKSVRDLANRFEQIIVSPSPAAASFNVTSEPLQEKLIVRNGRQPEVPSVEPSISKQRQTVLPPETKVSPPFDPRNHVQEQYQHFSSNSMNSIADNRHPCQTGLPPSISNDINGASMTNLQKPNDPGTRPNRSPQGPYSPGHPSGSRSPLVPFNGSRSSGKPSPELNENAKQTATGDRSFHRKKGKKSVTFSDQVVLVACAEHNEGFSLLNPLLEKVLHKSTNFVNPSANSTNNAYSQLGNGVEPSDWTKKAPPCSGRGNSFEFPSSSSYSGLPVRSSGLISTHNAPQKPNGYVASAPEVPCYLCCKKTVVPPIVYCVDCAFYMSRFKVLE